MPASESLSSEEAWKLVLSCVPAKQRLTSCSLVSQLLQRAATAARTESLDVTVQQHFESFKTWLSSHGSQVSALKLIIGPSRIIFDGPDGPSEVLMRASVPEHLDVTLPCQHLQQLTLVNFQVLQTYPPFTAARVFSNLAVLRSLQLSDCVLQPQLLQSLTTLQHLRLHKMSILCGYIDSDDDEDSRRINGSSGRGREGSVLLLLVLARLTQLTQLQLEGTPYCETLCMPSSCPELGLLSSLIPSSNLQQLHFKGCDLVGGELVFGNHLHN